MPEVIRVVPDHPGLAERIWSEFGALPGWGKVGAIAAVPAATVLAVAVGAETAAVAGLGLMITGLAGAFIEPATIEERLQTPDEVASLVDKHGNQLTVGRRYMQHPRRPHVLLSTDDFHSDILREQQGHLVSFIRSRIAATRIQIAISYEDKQDVTIKGSLFGLGRRETLSGSMLCDLAYAQPEMIAPEDDLFWLDHFSNVRAGLRAGGGGRKRFVEKFGKNLNCDAHVAEKYGFKADACKSYSLTILIET